MSGWVPPLPKHFPVLRLETIRSKILVFALLVTLVPSGLTAWISYRQNRNALEEKISQELLSSSSQAAREMDVWLKERLYDLRVFASSYEVSEKFTGSRKPASSSHDRLSDYLNSVRDRFGEYQDLVVLDPRGRLVAATSSDQRSALRLPADWAKELSSNGAVVGTATWDSSLQKGVLVVAVPVERGEGRMLGVMAARLNLRGAEKGLRAFAPRGGQVTLMTVTGGIMASSGESSAELMKTTVNARSLDQLKS
ncbi:MAG TPA: hypothetical protein VFD73_19290, partial [Gemmatimonadales bacterium]|nr:hypothetical protein [Gemmatimonadales bacterium]